MTKTQHILSFNGSGVKTSEIARIVGCSTAYVRAVWNRQRGGYAADFAKRKKMEETCDRPAALAARRKAYKEARVAGASEKAAKVAGARAYSKVVRETRDKEASNRAWRDAFLNKTAPTNAAVNGRVDK